MGFVRNIVKISVSVVRVCFLFDRSDSVDSFLFGGWYMILSLVFSGLLFLISINFVLLLLNRWVNNVEKFVFICLKVVSRCLCFFLFKLKILWCRVLIVFFRLVFLFESVLNFFCIFLVFFLVCRFMVFSVLCCCL